MMDMIRKLKFRKIDKKMITHDDDDANHYFENKDD